MNNLKAIGLALHNYHTANGCFPPAYVADASGKPMHSWRVLILPYLEQQDVYNRYRFDEPWDGPNNRKLHDLVISAYTCPSHPRPGHATCYLAAVGPETAWPGVEPIREKDVADGTKQTAVVLEAAASSVHWMDPRDLRLDQTNLQINVRGGLVGPSSHHPGGANMLFADGSVHFLRDRTVPRVLRALLTIAGHEQIGMDEY